MDQSTVGNVRVLEPFIRKSSINMMFFPFTVLLVLSSFKMLYTKEIATFNVLGTGSKILMKIHPLKF
jgi:hypothetical protein